VLLFGLQSLVNMGVRDIDAFGDSLLVVQQVNGESRPLILLPSVIFLERIVVELMFWHGKHPVIKSAGKSFCNKKTDVSC